jgi:hypothetical protein
MVELQSDMMYVEKMGKQTSPLQLDMKRARIKPKTPKQLPLDLVLAGTFPKAQTRW